MANSRIFLVRSGTNIRNIGREVEKFLRNERGMAVEGYDSSDKYFVQAKDATWKNFIGMGKNVQVQISRGNSNSEVVVNVGGGRWFDKVIVFFVGFPLFPPMFFAVALGTYLQFKLFSGIFTCIENFIVFGSYSGSSSTSPTSTVQGIWQKISGFLAKI